MSARELPEACKGELVTRGGARSPLKNAQLKSLRDAFAEVPDPRHPMSRRHPMKAMLSLIALGLVMGARDVLGIWRKVACLSQSQREAIGLRVRDKQIKRLKMPSYDALNDLLAAVNPNAQRPHAHTPTRPKPGCRPMRGCCPEVWPSMAKAWETDAAA